MKELYKVHFFIQTLKKTSKFSLFFSSLQVIEGSLYEQGATWYADDNIMDAKAASLASIQSSGVVPDTFSWWSNSGSGGVAGIAWVGTLCNSNGYGTNLNEKQGSAAGSGFVSYD